MEYRLIEIDSYVGTKLKQELTIQHSETLVVLLPGMGYTIYGPLLYYSYCMAVELGYDVLKVDYGFQKVNKYLDKGEIHSVIHESKTAIDKALENCNYSNLVIIGKSLGTDIMKNILESYRRLINVIPVFITPLSSAMSMIKSMKCLVILGTNDSHITKEDFEEMDCLEHVDLFIIEGADHSLEVGSFTESIEYVKQSIIFIRSYVVDSIKHK